MKKFFLEVISFPFPIEKQKQTEATKIIVIISSILGTFGNNWKQMGTCGYSVHGERDSVIWTRN